MKRLFALLLTAAVLTGLFCGCGTERKPYVPTGDGLSSDESTLPSSPVTEQQVTLCYYPDRSLNPFSCGDYTNRTLMALLYQPLFALDQDYNAVPILCRQYSVSRDMKTYTIYIEDATFSDGTALTAADVAASLQSAKRSTVYGGRFGNLESISTQDDGAVVLKLAVPYEHFELLLDVPIVKAAQVSDPKPLGTGPYRYEEYEGALRLRRRTDWWCSALLPVTAEYVGLAEGTGPSQIRDLYEFSDVSLVCTDPGADGYADFRSDYELWDCESGIFLYLACNADSYVFSREAIRAALTFAVDREALVQNHYRGFADEATLPASPLSPWYDQTLAAKTDYDPGVLTQAVEQAELEYKDVVLLVCSDDGKRVRAARALAEMLNACGLTVTTSELAAGEYRTALEEGAFDLHLGQTKLSANMDLSAFFAPEGSLSFGGLTDPTLYALCLESLANSGNYYTLHQKIAADGMLCPILFRSYAIYADRGLLTDFYPARDSIFFYTLGRTTDDALIEA